MTFEVLDAKGVPVMKGRMDYFFRDPRNGSGIIGEVKGMDLEALTPNQRVYVPLFEGEGAHIRITSSKGGPLKLPKGSIEVVRGENFVRIGRGNLKDFADALEQITTGKRVKFSFRDASGLRFFKDEAEFDAFLATKGITRTKVQPAAITGTKAPSATPKGKAPAGTATVSEPAPEVGRPADPAAHPTEPAPVVAEEPGGTPKGGGGTGGTLFAIAPLVLGYIHERTRAGRVEERAKEKGYVPQGDRGGVLERAGDVLFDPFGEGERNVPISARVNMAKWRQTARDWFSGHKPGDTVVYHWDYYRDSRDVYSRWFVYMLAVDGKWFIYAEEGDRDAAYDFMRDLSPMARDHFSKFPVPYTVTPSGEIPADINDVISPTVPDSAVERQMVYDDTSVTVAVRSSVVGVDGRVFRRRMTREPRSSRQGKAIVPLDWSAVRWVRRSAAALATSGFMRQQSASSPRGRVEGIGDAERRRSRRGTRALAAGLLARAGRVVAASGREKSVVESRSDKR